MPLKRTLLPAVLQLMFVIALALSLYAAACQRAGLVVDITELFNWAGSALLVSTAVLSLLIFSLIKNRTALTGKILGRVLMISSLSAFAVLLVQHFGSDYLQLSLFEVATLLLIAALFSLEYAVLQEGRCKLAAASAELFKKMRPAIFIFLFGIDLSMAFIPLHMEALPQAFAGISPELLIGLPISVEFLCVGIAILWCGVWLDRCGWQQPFYVGLVLTGIGSLYSWLAPDAVQFILSRGVLGLGYGLTLLAAQGYVIRHTDSGNKARGLAHLFAGLYSGSICGAATGAVLAEQFGYGPVFLLGSIIIFSVVIYGFWVLREHKDESENEFKKPQLKAAATYGNTDQKDVGVLAFICNKKVLAATLFSSMPAAIAVVGFLNYFSPVYLNRAGVGDAAIGQILMLFGVILALLGPPIGRFADRCSSKRLPIILGSLLGGSAFILFSLVDGVMAITLAILLLGLSNCLVLSSQSAFVLKQDVTHQFGEGKSMGVFRSSSRIGQMLGPIIFAVIITATDIESAVVVFGSLYLVAALIFTVMTRTDIKQLTQKEAN
ncbi:MFS transporter [Amphritea balenae]|uniref:MFS transporter n=2 Tax=Amphritea balenae TaxID=452629 RepID=A0A3P1SUF8_9GAMM|nr:MFS transporter [Amphritea balenae]